MQPGETVTPSGQPPEKPETPQQPAETASQTPVIEPATNWQFTANDTSSQPTAPSSSQQSVSWSASEYIAHSKGAAWFVVLGAALLILIAIIYFFTRSILASVLVGMAGFSFAVFAARPPRTLEYAVNNHGIQIGQKLYPYQDFKSFALLDDGPLPSVLLMPLKRFLPPITIFYDPKEEDAILNVLGDYLPHEDKQPDAIDRLMSRIRF